MTDYVVLVTGATGDIGRGVVRKILDQTDYKVVITVTPGNKEKYNFGARVEEIVMDASDISSVNIAIKRICMNQISHFIQLHGNSNTDDRLDVQNYERLIYHHNINIFSTIMIVQALLNGMKERKFGRICLMSTASSEHGGGPETFGYGMAKHSAGYLIKHLAKYYTSFNILSKLYFKLKENLKLKSYEFCVVFLILVVCLREMLLGNNLKRKIHQSLNHIHRKEYSTF